MEDGEWQNIASTFQKEMWEHADLGGGVRRAVLEASNARP